MATYNLYRRVGSRRKLITVKGVHGWKHALLAGCRRLAERRNFKATVECVAIKVPMRGTITPDIVTRTRKRQPLY